MSDSTITNESNRALIIEDEESIQTVVKGFLRGFECECVKTLSAGLALCQQLDIRLIVLDLGLDDAYGFDGLRALVEQFPHIPVVILTGDAREDRPLAAMRIGAQAYITKPIFSREEFYREVLYAMARHRNVRISIARIRDLEKRIEDLESRLKMRSPQHWKLKAGIATAILAALAAAATFFKEFIALFKKQ